MKRFVKGSVPNTVAHNCHCDVLIVETRHRLTSPDVA